MAGYQEDPTKWRLKTSDGIPYKVLGMTGGYDRDAGKIQVEVLIPSSSLDDFLPFIFPPPVQIGYILYPKATSLPGIPSLVATSLTFKSQDEQLPIDPYGFDPNAPSGTYYGILHLSIEYDTLTKQRKPNPNDPRTFLEISSNVSGEFLHTTMPNGHFVVEANKNVDTDGDGVPDISDADLTDAYSGPGDQLIGVYVDPETKEEQRGPITIYSDKVIKNPNVPIMITVPTTEFTVRYPQIDYEYFYNVFSHRLDAAMGKVNLKQVKWLHGGTERGTLLFAGYSHQERSTWRSGKLNYPPVTVEMKIIRKRIIWDGVIKGHQHVWNPKNGWEKVKLKESPTKYLYEEYDINRLFKFD